MSVRSRRMVPFTWTREYMVLLFGFWFGMVLTGVGLGIMGLVLRFIRMVRVVWSVANKLKYGRTFHSLPFSCQYIY
jgi:hypothetical protein